MKIRLRIFIFLNTIFLAVWIVYLFGLQILDPHNFKNRIEIRQNPSKKLIIPNRGNIYDRNDQLLVSSIKFYQLDIDKRTVKKYAKNQEKDISDIYNEISVIVADNSKEKKSSLYRKLNNSKSSSVKLTDEVSESQLIKIKERFKENRFPGLVSTVILNVLTPKENLLQAYWEW